MTFYEHCFTLICYRRGIEQDLLRDGDRVVVEDVVEEGCVPRDGDGEADCSGQRSSRVVNHFRNVNEKPALGQKSSKP